MYLQPSMHSMKTHQIAHQDGHVMWRAFGVSEANTPPLVLLHGGHGSWEHWTRNLERLAEHFHVFVPDMPGFGDSSFFGGELQSGMLDPLLASLDSLFGPDRTVNIAGFSFGGFVSAHLANQRRGVNRIALLGSAGHAGQRRPRGELSAWRQLYENQDWIRLKEVLKENLYHQMIGAYDRIDPQAIRIHQDACVRTRFRSKQIARPGGLAEQLQSYAGSSLLIWGEHDVTCTPEHLMDKLVNGWPNRSGVIIEDAGHWVQYETADQINQLLIDWFK